MPYRINETKKLVLIRTSASFEKKLLLIPGMQAKILLIFRNWRTWLYFWLAFALDQLSKGWVEGSGGTVINPGISFGWLAHLHWWFTQTPDLFSSTPKWFSSTPMWFTSTLFVLVMMAVLGLIAYLFRQIWQQHPVMAGIFFGAASSNIWDRIWYGGVRDFLPIPGTILRNNLADYLIVGSVTYILFTQLREGWLNKVKGVTP